MKSTGIVRSVDSLGRFVLPKELRDSFGITTDTPIEIFTDGNTILLRKYRADGCCDLCGEVTGDSILFRGKRICASSTALILRGRPRDWETMVNDDAPKLLGKSSGAGCAIIVTA